MNQQDWHRAGHPGQGAAGKGDRIGRSGCQNSSAISLYPSADEGPHRVSALPHIAAKLSRDDDVDMLST